MALYQTAQGVEKRRETEIAQYFEMLLYQTCEKWRSDEKLR